MSAVCHDSITMATMLTMDTIRSRQEPLTAENAEFAEDLGFSAYSADSAVRGAWTRDSRGRVSGVGGNHRYFGHIVISRRLVASGANDMSCSTT